MTQPRFDVAVFLGAFLWRSRLDLAQNRGPGNLVYFISILQFVAIKDD
jgi:hypothetical protein